MGWSLKGIIGGALVGGAGAAERHFVAEDNMARELAAKKEMADYTSEIEFNKKQRLQEWADTHGEEASAKNRAETGKLMSSATDYAKEQGHKFGSQGWYESTADYLVRQGRTDLAKDVYGQVNSVRADDTKDQIANMRKEMAAGRAARGSGGGGGGGDSSKAEDRQDKMYLDKIDRLGVWQPRESGEKPDDTARGYYTNIYYTARENGANPIQAAELVSRLDANARQVAGKNTGMTAYGAAETAWKQLQASTPAGRSKILDEEQNRGESLRDAAGAETLKKSDGSGGSTKKGGFLDNLFGDKSSKSAEPGIVSRTYDPGSGLSYIPADEFKLPITPGKNPRQSK